MAIVLLEADQQGDGPTTSQTGAAVHSRKLFTWRTTGKSGGQSLASTAHMGHEFTERKADRYFAKTIISDYQLHPR